MSKSKLVRANEKITERVVSGYQKIEDGVVGGYQKIESGVVNGFTKITDRFVEQFLTKEGETVQEAKERLAVEQAAREAEAADRRMTDQHKGENSPSDPDGGR